MAGTSPLLFERWVSSPIGLSLKRITTLVVMGIVLTIIEPVSLEAQSRAELTITLNQVPIGSTRAVLGVDTGVGSYDQNPVLTNSRSDTSITKQESTSITVGPIPLEFSEESKVFTVYGKTVDDSGAIVGFVPVVSYSWIDFKNRDKLKITINMTRSQRSAFLESYPINAGSGLEVFNFTPDNIVQSLNSVQKLVEEGYVGPNEWKDIYFLFQRNMGFFSSTGPRDFARVLRLLRSYSRTSSDIGFPAFYAEFLTQLVNLEVAGILPEGDKIEKYVYDELSFIIGDSEKFTIVSGGVYGSFSQADRALGAYFGRREFEICVALAPSALRSFSVALSDSSVDKNSLFTNMISTILTSTTCAQYLFVNKGDERASKNDVEGGASFLISTSDGQNLALELVKLIEKANTYYEGRVRDNDEIQKYFVVYRKTLKKLGYM